MDDDITTSRNDVHDRRVSIVDGPSLPHRDNYDVNVDEEDGGGGGGGDDGDDDDNDNDDGIGCCHRRRRQGRRSQQRHEQKQKQKQRQRGERRVEYDHDYDNVSCCRDGCCDEDCCNRTCCRGRVNCSLEAGFAATFALLSFGAALYANGSCDFVRVEGRAYYDVGSFGNFTSAGGGSSGGGESTAAEAGAGAAAGAAAAAAAAVDPSVEEPPSYVVSTVFRGVVFGQASPNTTCVPYISLHNRTLGADDMNDDKDNNGDLFDMDALWYASTGCAIGATALSFASLVLVSFLSCIPRSGQRFVARCVSAMSFAAATAQGFTLLLIGSPGVELVRYTDPKMEERVDFTTVELYAAAWSAIAACGGGYITSFILCFLKHAAPIDHGRINSASALVRRRNTNGSAHSSRIVSRDAMSDATLGTSNRRMMGASAPAAMPPQSSSSLSSSLQRTRSESVGNGSRAERIATGAAMKQKRDNGGNNGLKTKNNATAARNRYGNDNDQNDDVDDIDEEESFVDAWTGSIRRPFQIRNSANVDGQWNRRTNPESWGEVDEDYVTDSGDDQYVKEDDNDTSRRGTEEFIDG